MSAAIYTPSLHDALPIFHTHAEDIEDQPLAENFVRMGVTTLVLGNCGTSALNVREYLKQLESITISPNVATLVGHGTVDRKSTRLNSSHRCTSYAVFCLK